MFSYVFVINNYTKIHFEIFSDKETILCLLCEALFQWGRKYPQGFIWNSIIVLYTTLAIWRWDGVCVWPLRSFLRCHAACASYHKIYFRFQNVQCISNHSCRTESQDSLLLRGIWKTVDTIIKVWTSSWLWKGGLRFTNSPTGSRLIQFCNII